MAQNNNNLLTGLALLVGVAALGVSFVALAGTPDAPAAEETFIPDRIEETEVQLQDVQYVLYVGTNDKDSNEPVYGEEEARERLEAVLTENFGGFTIQDARGGWVNDDGSIAHEYTLIVYLSDTSLDEVHNVCDELIEEFNQSSILIQQNLTTTEFYEG